MPLYEYQCEKCGHRFEKIQKFSDRMVKKCPECGGKVEQMISAPAVQFKGSGWYVTDYGNKSHAPASESGSEAKKDEKTKSADASADSSSKDNSSTDASSKDSSKEGSAKESSAKGNSSLKGASSKEEAGKSGANRVSSSRKPDKKK